MEVWGEEIFPEGVGVKGKNGPPTPTSPLHQSSTGQPSKMAASNLIYYLAFRSQITPALQANKTLFVEAIRLVTLTDLDILNWVSVLFKYKLDLGIRANSKEV